MDLEMMGRIVPYGVLDACFEKILDLEVILFVWFSLELERLEYVVV